MNPDAAADQLPVGALRRCRIAKEWEPLERHGDLAAIHESNAERVSVTPSLDREGLNPRCGTS